MGRAVAVRADYTAGEARRAIGSKLPRPSSTDPADFGPPENREFIGVPCSGVCIGACDGPSPSHSNPMPCPGAALANLTNLPIDMRQAPPRGTLADDRALAERCAQERDWMQN